MFVFQQVTYESVSLGLHDAYAVQYTKAYLLTNGAFELVAVIVFPPSKYLFVPFVCVVVLFSVHSFQVKSNGDCLFRSIWSQMVFEDDEERHGALIAQTEQALTFTPYRLRLFILRQMLQHMDHVCIFVHDNVLSFTIGIFSAVIMYFRPVICSIRARILNLWKTSSTLLGLSMVLESQTCLDHLTWRSTSCKFYIFICCVSLIFIII